MNPEDLLLELNFKAVRSGGSGGQHVNKVSSKVVLFFNVSESEVLSEEEKEILIKNLKPKLTKDNVLVLNCDESRSQHQNKELVIKRFLALIEEALKPQKSRIPTKTPKSVDRKRLDEKRKQSQLKAGRKKPNID